jgi:hypothetical protein
MKIALQGGENYQQEVATRTKRGGTHDVLNVSPANDAQLEMRDGEGHDEVVSRQQRWGPRGRLETG